MRVYNLELTAVRGHGEKVTIFDTQRDFRARQDVHTRYLCTHSKAKGHYHSREAYKPYLWPRGMAINDHQLTESSIGEGLRSGAHALFVLL